MLVLTRQIHESIVIDTGRERIEVTVDRIRGGRDGSVRLGIAAPDHVSINRREVQDRIDMGLEAEGGAA